SDWGRSAPLRRRGMAFLHSLGNSSIPGAALSPVSLWLNRLSPRTSGRAARRPRKASADPTARPRGTSRRPTAPRPTRATRERASSFSGCVLLFSSFRKFVRCLLKVHEGCQREGTKRREVTSQARAAADRRGVLLARG